MTGPKVKYLIQVDHEDIPVRGSFASGDDAADKEDEDRIIRRLNRGDVWAWCMVTVTAQVEFDGVVYEGTDHLGGCSYEGEEEFKRDGYYEDMCASALDDLKRNVKAVFTDDIKAAERRAGEAVTLYQAMGW